MTPPPAPEGPVTLKEMLAGVRDEFIQWDRGFIGTFIALLWKPGAVMRGYAYERDPRWAKPWRYLTLCVVINVAVSWFVLDQLGLRSRLPIDEQQLRQTSFVLDHFVIIAVLATPILAAVMRVFFFGLQMRYVDALVLQCYTQGQASLLNLAASMSAAAGLPLEVAISLSVIIIVYMIWAWTISATGPWWRRILAATLTFVVGESLNGAMVFAALQLA